MKRCPECGEQFDDQEVFCDQDGASLRDETDVLREALNRGPNKPASSAWITGVIGGFVGVLVCVLLYALFLVPPANNADEQESRTSTTAETATQRSAQVAVAPAPLNTPAAELASPSPEEEAIASPVPTVEPAPTTVPAALNKGPIATGSKEEVRDQQQRAIITLRDGSSVEADAAWEDSQGIWYRRGTMVSFVDRARVEKITGVPEEKKAASEPVKP